jgi:hypothetical protein
MEWNFDQRYSRQAQGGEESACLMMTVHGWIGDGVKGHESLASRYAAGMVFIGHVGRNSGQPVPMCSHLRLESEFASRQTGLWVNARKPLFSQQAFG